MREKITVFLKDNIIVFIAAAILLFTLFGAGFMRTSGHSMEPTIHDGSFLFIQKAFYAPGRNDICVAWNGSIFIVKRVVGLPGETVRIDDDGNIFIDGVEYDNKFQSAYYDADYVDCNVILGNDEYFLLGDNRPDSKDSRMIGPIERKDIIGKVVWIQNGDSDPYTEN